MHDKNTAIFGRQLRYWRGLRGMSQLDLAASAETTSRHISFLETGRSRPRKSMVLRLADSLDIPLRERNELLASAGIGAEYEEQSLESPELAPFRKIMDRLLEIHEPYPALVVNRWYDLVRANKAGARFFGFREDTRTNLIEMMSQPQWKESIVNWPDVARGAVRRLRIETLNAGNDPRLATLLQLAEKAIADLPPADDGPAADLVICPKLRFGDKVIRTISTMARFGSSREITLDELRIEIVHPYDDEADQFFNAMAQLGELPAGMPR